ncbi:YggS family pyridoxal phosphate-dependent enzyme [Jidongwangia harbinensis]|uniref:YggS family pyridoxal phosphate-dependent enzyme n=1 Tax=Jidongwangia harbinensis TaxID=2878561 RepID=UPI001CDA383E|nr:YggS family pyridoxal phosphate-dependent enzyme [Jidongwangia harbinensis]MCA2212384.1 YggS family pyridoxal phosphate-dependent enzyme [Jidongwangia harbinensis]
MADTGRRAQLAASLDEVRERIARACTAAGRDPSEVTLVAVTKTYPADDVRLLAGLGVTDVGENKDQEASGKAAELSDLPLRWHFVGQLQRNKARSVVTYAEVVESVDSRRLARALDGAAGRHRDRPLDVLVQVSLDGDLARGGAVPGGIEAERDLWQVADAVAGSAHLRLGGVMTVAPPSWHPDLAFEKLAEVRARLLSGHPDATVVSAGMSGDLESAIVHGATHVRIGTSLLGMRNKLR